MELEKLRNSGWIAMECISGSRAYGLATPESDTDIKGVFVLPKSEFYGLDYLEQVSNPSNDIVFYELRRFVDLLSKNNPNILELLATPEESILFKDPLLDQLRVEDFLSKLCLQSFGNYAMAQIKKAKGLNKKIMNPIEKEKKGVLDFCYVVEGQGSVSLSDFLVKNQLRAEDCGLSKIPHMHEVYGLYYEPGCEFSGVVNSVEANDVCLSSIPKGLKPVAIFSFNKSGYSSYCKDYKEYWDWVENRNQARYENTKSHGKNYDSKNMMHTFRLLNMAEEIGERGELRIWREDRDFLLAIKAGAYSYEDLVKMAEFKMENLQKIYNDSTLPNGPDITKVNLVLSQLRESFYAM